MKGTTKLIRVIQRNGNDKNNPGRILIPIETGLKPEDIIQFEVIDENNVKMTRIA